MAQRQIQTSRLIALFLHVPPIVGVVLTAAGCGGDADSSPTSDSEIGIMSAAATAASFCGDRCGPDLLVPGQACCTTGDVTTPYDVATQCCTLGIQNKYPIQNLDDCPARKFHPSPTDPNKQDPPTLNGCSDLVPLALNAFAPGVVPLPGIETFIFGVANKAFRQACDSHDTCYGTCDTNPAHRAQCDDQMLNDMRQTCRNDRLLRRWPIYGYCVSAAQIMYGGVSVGGGPLYDRAQRGVDGHGGCDCCAGDTSCALGNADLNVTSLAIPPNPVEPGSVVQFQFDIKNTGPEAATSLTVTLDFTSGLSQPTPAVYAAGTGPVPCNMTALVGGGSLATCVVARLDVGETAVIKGSGTTTAPGQESAFASATAIQIDRNQFDNAGESRWVVQCPESGTVWDPAMEECSPECVPPPGSIVAWWPGDGDAADIAGANAGFSQNGAAFAEGEVDQSFLFDGSDDHVVVYSAPALDIAGDVTVELWASRSTFGSQQHLLIKGAGTLDGKDAPASYVLQFFPDDTIIAGFERADGSNVVVTGPAITDSRFHHYAYVRSGGSHRLFLDGQQVAGSTFTGAPGSTAQIDLTIGSVCTTNASACTASTQGALFAGRIDEVSVYNQALLDAEISAIYRAGTAGKCKVVQ